jgi:hypothetical protein
LLTGCFDSPHRMPLMPLSHSYRSGRPRWWTVNCEVVSGPGGRPGSE